MITPPDRLALPSAVLDKSLAVVVPMANERASAAAFLAELVAELSGWRQLAIFVVFDHACRDGTIDIVRGVAAGCPAIRIVWAPENRSVVDAYCRGYREAIGSGADWILEMDAGFSHAPGEVQRLLAALAAGGDCAFGSRFGAGGRAMGMPWRRSLVSRGGTALTNLLLGTRQRDMTSGFQLFTREALSRILAQGLRSRGPFFQTEMKVYARRLRWQEVPITYRPTASAVRAGAIRDAFSVLLRLFLARLAGRLAAA